MRSGVLMALIEMASYMYKNVSGYIYRVKCVVDSGFETNIPKELAVILGVSIRTIQRIINNFKYIVYKGSGNRGHWEIIE